MDAVVQTCPNNFCYFCCFQLREEAAVQSHVFLLSHSPQGFGDLDFRHLCRLCRERVPLKWGPTHKCCGLKTTYITRNTSAPLLQGGPPFRCLLCRGRAFKSRSDLVVHLLAYHRPNRPRGQCGLCEFKFEEPPPNPPKIPPPPQNAEPEKIREYKKALLEAELNELIKPESGEPKPSDLKLERHCATEHNPLFRVVSRKTVNQSSDLREPYTCFLCQRGYKNNWDYHAHILCRHGIGSELRGRLMACAMCGETSASEDAFDKHVHSRHTLQIQCLADFLEKNELLQNYVCCATTCAFCWERFNEDFELQAHIVAAHTSPKFLQCGWCKMEFGDEIDPLDAFLIFLSHEHNHARELHATALETHMTRKAMPPSMPDDFSKEAVEASLKALAGDGGDEEAKSKGKEKSKSKGSKEKSKSKSKGKKDSSKKGNKSKGSKK